MLPIQTRTPDSSILKRHWPHCESAAASSLDPRAEQQIHSATFTSRPCELAQSLSQAAAREDEHEGVAARKELLVAPEPPSGRRHEDQMFF
jgi:hypothetical protein